MAPMKFKSYELAPLLADLGWTGARRAGPRATRSAVRPPDLSIRPDRRARIRHALGVSRSLALGLFAIKPIEEVGAEVLVRAPNAGRRTFPVRIGEIRVDVGPPAAVLSIAVVDVPSPKGTVFVLHGIRESKESLLGWARWLAGAGYRALLVDSRGHGGSTGDSLTYGVQESLDLTQVLDALQKRQIASDDVGVMGHSYGAATAIEWAGRDPRVKAVVAVAPFSSLRAVVPGYLPVRLPDELVRRAIDLAGVRGGFDPDAASPEDAIARTRARVLLIHGRADNRIPAWHSERIRAAGPDHAEIVLVDRERHGSVAGAPATRLAARAADWFAAHLG
jgi:pimeloyl-ACP methyl ester carboxylesterase